MVFKKSVILSLLKDQFLFGNEPKLSFDKFRMTEGKTRSSPG